ncbi:NADPH:quinone oxidoreductase family protein [Tistrella mobilis]
MIKAVLCTKLGGPEDLEIKEIQAPEMKPGHVRVRVRAAGVNFADTLIIQGKYQVRPELPFSPGIELAGEVMDVAADVTHLKPGQRVMGMAQSGAYTQEVVLPAAAVVPIPDMMDFASAAAFPVAYGTSHVALDHRAHLKAGEKLLVLGAAGGVGLTAVEIGAAMGAEVVAVASSPEKLEVARAHGATHLIDYSKDDLREKVKELVGGVDVVYDPVGGAAFDASLRCINWEGRILVIGFASGTIPQIPANLLLVKNVSVVGTFWGAYMHKDPKVLGDSLKTLLGWYAEGKLKPHVSETFPMVEAPKALRALMERRSTGKVVIDLN